MSEQEQPEQPEVEWPEPREDPEEEPSHEGARGEEPDSEEDG